MHFPNSDWNCVLKFYFIFSKSYFSHMNIVYIFSRLLVKDRTEQKLTSKIRKHLEVKETERQKVKDTVQLFLERTGEALKYILPEHDKII